MRDIHPAPILTTGNKRQHINAYKARIRVGFKYFIIKLPDIRPIMNKAKPIDRK